MWIAAIARTCALVLVVLAGATSVVGQPFAGPGRPIGPFVRPMGAPYMRPFGRPFFRFFGRPAPAVGFAMRPGGRLFPPPRARVCFTPAETREMIVANRLTDPFRALTASGLEGDALRTRLCRWKADQFVYEVAVLRRDGRLVRVYMDAQSGRTVDAPNRQ